MRSTRSLLVILVGLPLLLVLALAASLPLISWHATNDAGRRAWIAARLSALSDGDVDLSGPVLVRLFPRPELHLSRARFKVDRQGVRGVVAVESAVLRATMGGLVGLDLGWSLALREPDVRINTGRQGEPAPGIAETRKVLAGLEVSPLLCAWMPGRIELTGGQVSVGGFGIDLEQVVIDLADTETVLDLKGVERQSRRPLEARGRRGGIDKDAVAGVVEFNLLGAEVDVAFTLRDLRGPGGILGCWPRRIEAEVKFAADDPGEVWSAAVRAVTPRGRGARSDTPRARPAQPDRKAPRLTGGAMIEIMLSGGGGRPPVRVNSLQARVDSVDLLTLNDPRIAVPPPPVGDSGELAAILREVEGRLRQLVSSAQRVHTWEAPVTGVADRLDSARRAIELTAPAELRIDRATLLGAEFTDTILRAAPPALARPGICVGGAPLQLEIGRARIGDWDAPLVMAATVDYDRAEHRLDSDFCALGFGSGQQEAAIVGKLAFRQSGARSGIPGQAVEIEVEGMLPRVDAVAGRLRQPNEGALDASSFSHAFKLSATARSRRDNVGRNDEVIVTMRELRIDNFALRARLHAPRGGTASLMIEPVRGEQLVDGTGLLSLLNVHPTMAAAAERRMQPMPPSGRCVRPRVAPDDVILVGSVELPRLKFGDGVLEHVSLDLHLGATGLALDDLRLEMPGGTRLSGDIRAFTQPGALATSIDGCLDVGLRSPQRLVDWVLGAQLLTERSPLVRFLALSRAAELAGTLMLTRTSIGDIEARLIGVEAELAGQRGALKFSGTMHSDRAAGRVRLVNGRIDLPTFDAVLAWRLYAILDGRPNATPPRELAGRQISISGGSLDVEFVNREPQSVLLRAGGLGLHPVNLRDVQFTTLSMGAFEAKARMGKADAAQFASIYDALAATFGSPVASGGARASGTQGVIDIAGESLAVPISYFGAAAAKPTDRIELGEYSLRAELRNGGLVVDRFHGVLDLPRIRRDTPCQIGAAELRDLRGVFRTDEARGNRVTIKAAVLPVAGQGWRADLDMAITCIAPLDLRYLLSGKQDVARGSTSMAGRVGYLRMKLGGPLANGGFALASLRGEGNFEALIILKGDVGLQTDIFSLGELDDTGMTFRGRLGLGDGRLQSVGEPWVAVGNSATLTFNMISDLRTDCITVAANVRSHREVASRPGFDQYFQVEWARELRWEKYELRQLNSWKPFKAADNCPGPPAWPPPPGTDGVRSLRR